MMYNLIWSRKGLSSQKLGTFGEYYAKMTLASYGMDIYTSEVDDHGIDFIAEANNSFLRFQVKTIRIATTNYIYMKSDDFNIREENLYLILVLLKDNEHPDMYIVPATAWSNPKKTAFVFHSYEGKKSKPEYGINLSKKNMDQLDEYKLERFISDRT